METTTDASWYRRPCFCIVALLLELFLWPWSPSQSHVSLFFVSLLCWVRKIEWFVRSALSRKLHVISLIITVFLLSVCVPVSFPVYSSWVEVFDCYHSPCYFNTVRCEELLGNAISRNLRIKPFVLFYYSISLVERMVLITRKILLFYQGLFPADKVKL